MPNFRLLKPRRGNTPIEALLAFLVFVLTVLFLIIAPAIGWVLNLVQVLYMLGRHDPNTLLILFKGAAVFVAPVGAILGWIGLFFGY